MNDLEIMEFINDKKIGIMKLGGFKELIFKELGQPDEISKLNKTTKIYTFYNRLLQITVCKDNIYLIALEFLNLTGVEFIKNNKIKKIVNFFKSITLENILNWLKNNNYNYSFSKYDPDNVIVLENEIFFIFSENKKIDSIQLKFK